jgi:hypothetical protein
MKKLTVDDVRATVMRVLFRNDELVDGKPVVEPVVVEGIMSKFGFHPERLEAERENVRGMLAELPEQFISGGGWSFMSACMDKDGRQWGEQRDVELLMCLGLALGMVSYTFPRKLSPALPGGVPYFTVDLNGTEKYTVESESALEEESESKSYKH